MDTRLKREERTKIIDDFVHAIGKLYGVQVVFSDEIWSFDDPETPYPEHNTIRVTIQFREDGLKPKKTSPIPLTDKSVSILGGIL